MRLTVLLIILTGFGFSACEERPAPGTEVYLFDLEVRKNGYAVSNPVNISDNPGYDNQPSFSPDGSYILFASTRNGQTDIRKYDIETQSYSWLTETKGSEYSPTVMPDGEHFSAINLKPDGEQLLWKYPLTGTGSADPEVIVPDLKIGYHAWHNADTLISFVLSDSANPATLQLNDLRNGENIIIAEEPGRSLHKIPNADSASVLMSYILKSGEEFWFICELDLKTMDTSRIIPTICGSEDMAWTPRESILMGSGSKLIAYLRNRQMGWMELADLNEFGLTDITRIAVSPNGDRIALVVTEVN